MARKYSKSKAFTLKNHPFERQPDESESQYKAFRMFADSNFSMSYYEIADAMGFKIDTIHRYARHAEWMRRKSLILGGKPTPTPIIVPDQCDPVAEILEGDDKEFQQDMGDEDPVTLRIAASQQISEGLYFEATDLHRKLFMLAQSAVDNLNAEDLTSISDIKHVVTLTQDLAKMRQELSDHITGVNELAQHVQALRKHSKKRR